MAIEQRGRLGRCPFNGEQAVLGRGPAGRRKAARLAGGRHHAMAWHDDRAGVLAHRLADAARVRFAKLRRNGPVGEGRAGLDGSCHRVDAAVEFRHAAKVEHNVKIVGRFPSDSHPPIVYPVALTMVAKPDARRYLDFLRTGTAQVVFESYGFTFLVPPGP